MSYEEIKSREKRLSIRKIWSCVLIVLIVIFSLISVLSVIFNVYGNKKVNIEYKETSSINYHINLVPNEYYDEVESGQAYVASLIDEIDSDFKYSVSIKTDVDYSYSYKIEKYIDFNSVSMGSFKPQEYELLVNTSGTHNSGTDLDISENIVVSYKNANIKAVDFINYVKDSLITANLVVKMTINVNSESADFNENNTHVILYRSPLAVQTTNVTVTSTVPAAQGKTIQCLKNSKLASFTAKVYPVTIVLDVLFVLALILFINFTSNKYIKYSIRIKNILRGYKSFIQVTSTSISVKNYQLVKIHSIREMLELRETLSLPIIMKENNDKTCSKFFIIKDNFMYIYSDCVEGFESLKYTDEDDEDVFEKTKKDCCLDNCNNKKEDITTQTEPLLSNAKQEATEEKLGILNVDVETNNDTDEIDEVLEEESDGYEYSFDAKLALANDQVKGFYSEIELFARSYGVKVKSSFKKERIYLGRDIFGEMVFRGKKLAIFLALNPQDYVGTKYKFKDFSKAKKYEKTPMLVKITSGLKVRYVKELLSTIFKNAGVKNKNLSLDSKKIETKTMEQLIEEGRIKIK